jgi:hypothetical protein
MLQTILQYLMFVNHKGIGVKLLKLLISLSNELGIDVYSNSFSFSKDLVWVYTKLLFKKA